MKIETSLSGQLILEEVYENIHFKTKEGNTMGVCMRDDTFELSIKKNFNPPRWMLYRVDIQNGTVVEIS